MIKLRRYETAIHSLMHCSIILFIHLFRFIKHLVNSNFNFNSGMALNLSASKPILFGKIIEYIRERLNSQSVIVTKEGGNRFMCLLKFQKQI